MLARALEMGMHRPEEAVKIDGIQFDYFEQVFVRGVKEFEELFASNPIEG